MAGSTGRSKVTEMVTPPLAASAQRDRPHRAVDDPRPGGDDHRPIVDVQGQAGDGAVVEEAVVEVAGPDRVDLAVEDRQAHLIAVAEGRVPLAISPDWLSACGPKTWVWPVIASMAVLSGLA